MDKYEAFRKQQGVYVGESARSIFERAGEHLRDAQGQKDDSHMHKHWKTAHPDLPEAPQFNIKVVASFQDALSRQLSEAVRIDLRGGNVLNSKSEYSRCRVPRLRIDKEEWKVDDQKEAKDKKKKEALEEQARVAEESLLTGGAVWDISTNSRGLKSQKREGGKPESTKRSKKRKMELLIGWGVDEEGEDDNQEVVDTWLTREEPPEAMKSTRMKQMEISLKQVAGTKTLATPTPGPSKLSKEEKLARAAIGSRKMTDWLVKKNNNEEWDDDPDLPELEAIEQIEQREQRRRVEEQEGARNYCGSLVDIIVDGLEATSSASQILEGVLETAWETIRLESTWRMLQEDRAMQDIILTRIKNMKDAKARDEKIKLEVVDMANDDKDTPKLISEEDKNVPI